MKDVKKARRKSFKEELLTEFSGRLIIDFRRHGSGIVMNDMVCILGDEINFQDFRMELVHEHERIRGNSVTWPSPDQAIFHGPEKLSGNLSVIFYTDQRKILAQAKPESLNHFVTYYSNTINKSLPSMFPPKYIVAASQEPTIAPEVCELSQAQS